MPVYNEAATVAAVLTRVLQESCVQEIIVVDDYSADGSWELIQRTACDHPQVKTFRHETN